MHIAAIDAEETEHNAEIAKRKAMLVPAVPSPPGVFASLAEDSSTPPDADKALESALDTAQGASRSLFSPLSPRSPRGPLSSTDTQVSEAGDAATALMSPAGAQQERKEESSPEGSTDSGEKGEPNPFSRFQEYETRSEHSDSFSLGSFVEVEGPDEAEDDPALSDVPPAQSGKRSAVAAKDKGKGKGKIKEKVGFEPLPVL